MISRHIRAELDHLAVRQGQIVAAERDRRDPARRDELVAAQAEFDGTYRLLGASAPPPERGEGLNEFRGRLVAALLPYTQNLKEINPFAVVGTPVEAEVIKEVAAGLADRHKGDPFDPGRLRKVETQDGGMTRIEWHGDNPNAWMDQFKAPFQVAQTIKMLDKSGREAPPPIRWGTPPARR